MKKFILMTLILWISASTQVLAKRVLVLNSYHPQYKWTELLLKGIRKTLSPHIPPEDIHIEYMDGRRFSDDIEYTRRIKSLIGYKYRHYPIDLIITTDDYAFQFLRSVHDDIFPQAPVVFAGVNFFKPELLNGHKDFTGVLEGTSIEENIDLIQKIYPGYKEIVLLSDRTTVGLHLSQNAREIIKRRGLGNKVSIYEDFSLNELKDRLKTTPKGVYYLLLAIHHDNQGNYFSYDEHLIEISKISKAPIFSMWGILIGNGTVGGYMNNPVTHGEEVANLALRLISGDSISTMPVIEKTKYSPQFDYNQLVRFQISKSSLPSESKIFFRPISYYEDNKLAINIVLFVIAVLISFIIILNRLVIKRTRQANQTAQRLAKSNAKMKEFVGIVAHDLRAPVGNILSFTKALEEAPEDQEEIVPYIIKSANKSINLINNILDISAIESGKVKIQIEDVDLHEVIKDTISELTFLTKKKSIHLESNLGLSLIVKADRQRITQILQNLLTNAIKFTPNDGTISIDVEDNQSFVNVSVKDSGVGIPKELLSKIFKRNEFTSRPGTEGEAGTGYGLPLVYNLIKEHGSTLTVESQENLGSKFTFQLKKAL